MNKLLQQARSLLFPQRRPEGLRRASKGQAAALTAEQRERWARDGYLLLEGMLSPAEIRAVLDVVDRQWSNPAQSPFEVDVLTGPNGGRAYKMPLLPEGSRNEAYKMNNLFAREKVIRQVALSPRLRPVLAELLNGEPLICNSLNFERGSQQDFHIDSWYMPAPGEGNMIAASMALEEVDEENGPIAYYPASHLIPPYRFSDGRLNEIASEKIECRLYLDREIQERSLMPQEVRAKPGDVFIWHGQLLHSGRPIRDFTRTRNSLVVHYWKATDLPVEHVHRDNSGAYLGHTLRGELQA